MDKNNRYIESFRKKCYFTKDDIAVRNILFSRSGFTSNQYKAIYPFNTSATSYIATWRNDGYNHVLVTFDKVYDLNDILNIVIDTRSKVMLLVLVLNY